VEAVVRLMMRMLALLIAACVVIVIVLLARSGVTRLRSLTQAGPLGISTLVNWGVTLLAGPFAFVQLMRLRNSGRIAGAIVFGVMTLYYLAAAFLFRDPGDPLLPVAFTALVTAACTAMLLIPAARQACVDAGWTAVDAET
jgi:CDP-diglyceride synthetase